MTERLTFSETETVIRQSFLSGYARTECIHTTLGCGMVAEHQDNRRGAGGGRNSENGGDEGDCDGGCGRVGGTVS